MCTGQLLEVFEQRNAVIWFYVKKHPVHGESQKWQNTEPSPGQLASWPGCSVPSAGGRQNARVSPGFLSTPWPMAMMDFPFIIVAQLTFRKGDCPAGLALSHETHLGLEVRDRKSGVKQ